MRLVIESGAMVAGRGGNGGNGGAGGCLLAIQLLLMVIYRLLMAQMV